MCRHEAENSRDHPPREAGAAGHLLKDHASENLIEAIRTVAGGGFYLDRFGPCLLHRHFEARPDEVLNEDHDQENRVLTIRPAGTWTFQNAPGF